MCQARDEPFTGEIYFTLTTSPWAEYLTGPIFTDKETEVQRERGWSKVTCIATLAIRPQHFSQWALYTVGD